MIVSCGGVTSTAKETVSVATCPRSDKSARANEVAVFGRSTGAFESTDNRKDARPEPESLAVQVTSTAFVFRYESADGEVIARAGALGSKWKGTVTFTEFPARSVASTTTE